MSEPSGNRDRPDGPASFGHRGGDAPGFTSPRPQQPSAPPPPPEPAAGGRASFPWLPLGFGAAIALVVVLVLNLTGAPVFTGSEPGTPSGQPGGQPSAQSSGPAAAAGPCEDPAAPSESGSPAPEPTPEPAPPTNYPRADAGVVAPKKPATISGFGNTEVDYRRVGDILTAYQFDCPDCQKKMRLYDRGNDQQLISFETAPFSDSWLLDRPVRAQSKQNSMVIEADGHWTLTVRHAADLPAAGDLRTGQGQAMINVSDGGARELDFHPYDADDSLNYNVVDVTDGSNGPIGCTEDGTVEVDNDGKPYILLLSTYGDWSLRRR